MEQGDLIPKLLGVFSGAFLALVFDPPRTRLGFARRFAAAVVFGYIFGPMVLTLMEWPILYDNVVAAFCTASFVSWSAMGLIRKVVDNYKKDA